MTTPVLDQPTVADDAPYAEIPLRGMYAGTRVALVDVSDLHLVKELRWRADLGTSGVIYAAETASGNFMHNLLMGATGIDHINGNGLDNRRCNLRHATRAQNAANARKRPMTSSRYKGVKWRRDAGKWQATIGANGGTSLGMFVDEAEAARAYDAAARERFGEFAAVNFPMPGEQSCLRPTVQLERAIAGDPQAFASMWADEYPRIYKFIRARVGSNEWAEDLASETFARAYSRISTFTWQGREIAAWLTTIAKNLVADFYKSSRNRRELLSDDVLVFEREDLQDNPESIVANTLLRREVNEALAKLKPEQRCCLQLRFLRDLSVTETAEMMGKTEAGVRAATFRALRALSLNLPKGYLPGISTADRARIPTRRCRGCSTDFELFERRYARLCPACVVARERFGDPKDVRP